MCVCVYIGLTHNYFPPPFFIRARYSPFDAWAILTRSVYTYIPAMLKKKMLKSYLNWFGHRLTD